MKGLLSLTLAGCLLLAGCAVTLNRSGARLTCPSCGYQFDAPVYQSP